MNLVHFGLGSDGASFGDTCSLCTANKPFCFLCYLPLLDDHKDFVLYWLQRFYILSVLFYYSRIINKLDQYSQSAVLCPELVKFQSTKDFK